MRRRLIVGVALAGVAVACTWGARGRLRAWRTASLVETEATAAGVRAPVAVGARPAVPTTNHGVLASPRRTSAGEPVTNEWLKTCEKSDAGGLSCIRCGADFECPPGQGCAMNRETSRQECVGSNCREDSDCAAGFSCRAVGRERKIQRCVEHGDVPAGGLCSYDPWGRGYSCAPGLLCVRGHCGAPCRNGECSEGEKCIDTPDGPACHRRKVSCRDEGCPEGKTCEQVGDGQFFCVKQAIGDNCITNGCGEGRTCEVVVQAAIAVYQCKTKCDPLAPKCPVGNICGASQDDPRASVCYKSCAAPWDCPEGESCTTISEDHKQWGCVPDPGPKPPPGALSYDPENGEEPFRPED